MSEERFLALRRADREFVGDYAFMTANTEPELWQIARDEVEALDESAEFEVIEMTVRVIERLTFHPAVLAEHGDAQ